MDLFDKVTKKT